MATGGKEVEWGRSKVSLVVLAGKRIISGQSEVAGSGHGVLGCVENRKNEVLDCVEDRLSGETRGRSQEIRSCPQFAAGIG